MSPLEFTQLVVLVLGTVTVTYGVTESALLAIPRMIFATRARWCENLIYCPVCSSFWAGALVGLLVLDTWWVLRLVVGALVGPGFIALMRSTADPNFLPGAQHEREHVQRIRDGDDDSDDAAESAEERPAGAERDAADDASDDGPAAPE